MAVPRNDAAGLHLELTQAEQPAVKLQRFLRQVGARADDVGHVFRRGRSGLLSLAVRDTLVGRAFAGACDRRGQCQRAGRSCRDKLAEFRIVVDVWRVSIANAGSDPDEIDAGLRKTSRSLIMTVTGERRGPLPLYSLTSA